ncbi:hypothetical protein [Paraburkholderia sprentiae]|uniref:hypothetical protein n=1 Tax=Paraburkholderia sprentiae TaxID=948107 RepID=UPI000B173074|nr:hypothetical protein [Paraburkholderia sprentiae]
MAAPSFVYTISCVANMRGEPEDWPEDWLDELANMNLEPEDGCLGIIDDLDVPAEQLISVTAFTDAGIEALNGASAGATRACPIGAQAACGLSTFGGVRRPMERKCTRYAAASLRTLLCFEVEFNEMLAACRVVGLRASPG